MKYINKTRVPFSETGVKKGISVIGAAHMIEDNVCAFFAAFGRDSASVRAKYNVVWMFVKNKFRFGTDVVWNEEISVESFFTQIAAASVTVDTVIKNSKGETVVYARTETCAIDLDTYRIRRISSVELPDIEVYDSAAGFDFTRFSEDNTANAKKVYTITVPSTSIDFCGHVNNVEYLRFILNSATVQKELTNPVREVEIHFVKQSRENELLSLFCSENNRTEVYGLKNGEDIVVRCKINRDG